MSQVWRFTWAVLFRRYDRWDWLLSLALLVALLITEAGRVLVALVGVILGQQSLRAARAWREKA